ncbi:MAG: HAD family hydrolase [Nitrospirae bacterium]|nr:MAG: HAD family hydrolase [Nitrospirota bacterium]
MPLTQDCGKGGKALVLLFDIDGTLLESGEAGTRALNRAFQSLFSIPDGFKGISMAGKTDIQIMKEALQAHGIGSSDGALQELTLRYIDYLKEEIDNPRKKLKPGVREFLQLVHKKAIPSGLLTGNIKEGAHIKLGAFGLNRFFIDGAYGSDHEDRNRLLPIAVKRLNRKGINISYKQCVVIGDTPRDVECAKIHGAKCIAVSTGPYSYDELKKTDADLVVESLQEQERILEFLKT